MRSLRAILKSVIARARFEREMRDELRLHIEHRADDLARSGLSRDEALRRARLEFGAVERYKEECRDASGFAPLRLLHGSLGDVKRAARRLAAAWLFTLFAVLSLAVGLGLTTAAYSVIASLCFTTSGIPDEDRLVSVVTAWEGRLVDGGFSTVDVEELRASQRSLASLTAYTIFRPSVVTPSGTDLMRAEAVDGAYFATLGIHPVFGRAIREPDLAASAPVVVLSHALWSRRFAADPAIVGQTVRIGGEPFEVIGVTPKEFRGFGGPFGATHLWLPVSSVPRTFASGLSWTDRERPRFMVAGRLAHDGEVGAAAAELGTIGAAIDAAYPKTGRYPGPQRRAWSTRLLSDESSEDEILWRFGVVLVALVALVLVVACTNLANLVLARGTARQQEFAVRRAIGASRWRLVREQCVESLLLAVLGAVGAWLVFGSLAWALDVDLPITSKLLVSLRPTLDPSALAVVSVALLLSLLVFGLEPALHLTRADELRGGLSESAGAIGVPRATRQRTLVRWQVAISTGFFIIAALAVRYTVAEARHDSGVDLDRLGVATVSFWAQQWDGARARQTLTRVLDQLQKDPSVESAAIATGVPFGSTGTTNYAMSTVDKPITPDGTFRRGPGIAATPRVFQTLGVRIVRGRAFDHRDEAGADAVVIISERTAIRLFGTSDVVGRQMLIKPRALPPQGRSVARKLALPSRVAPMNESDVARAVTVVGVASDTDVGALFSDDGTVLYLPFSQEPARFRLPSCSRARAEIPTLPSGHCARPSAEPTRISRSSPQVPASACWAVRLSFCGRRAASRSRSAASRCCLRWSGSTACSRTAWRTARARSAFACRSAPPPRTSGRWC